jgi:hypothetical protein
MEFVGKHRLVAHADHAPKTVRSVDVGIWRGRGIMLRYGVEPANALALPDRGFERADRLWRSTCFELFLKAPGDAAYREFNFAPPGAWNAYAFSDWRRGMERLELAEPPQLVDCRIDGRKDRMPHRYELDVVLGYAVVSSVPSTMSLTAIIQDVDESISYWALAHGAGEPDFHHPACFTAALPPIAAA